MFIDVDEDTEEVPLHASRTFCKDCEQYAMVRLIERVRTVTVYWVLKSTERRHFLVCGACGAEFLVKPHERDLEQIDLHALMRLSGGRFVSFQDKFILFLALVCLPVPGLNLVLVWAAWRNRARYTPAMTKLLRVALWAAPAVNVAMLLAALFEKPYQP